MEECYLCGGPVEKNSFGVRANRTLINIMQDPKVKYFCTGEHKLAYIFKSDFNEGKSKIKAKTPKKRIKPRRPLVLATPERKIRPKKESIEKTAFDRKLEEIHDKHSRAIERERVILELNEYNKKTYGENYGGVR